MYKIFNKLFKILLETSYCNFLQNERVIKEKEVMINH